MSSMSSSVSIAAAAAKAGTSGGLGATPAGELDLPVADFCAGFTAELHASSTSIKASTLGVEFPYDDDDDNGRGALVVADSSSNKPFCGDRNDDLAHVHI